MCSYTVRFGAALAGLALIAGACSGEGDPDVEFGTVTDGTLTACSAVPYAPFEVVDSTTETGFSGFDIELIEAIADELGLELEVVDAAFDDLTSGAAMSNGTCDLAASAMTITDEREANVDFSEPYYAAAQSLIVKRDSGIASLADVSDRRIGVESGTTGERYAREHAEGAEILAATAAGDLFIALDSGDVDAILQDLPVNAERAASDDSLEVVETYETNEHYGFAFSEEGSQDLLAAVNDALERLRGNGLYDEIYAEYFEAPSAPM